MDIHRINFVYFSPTGTTRRVVEILKTCFDIQITEYNLTNYKCMEELEKPVFGEKDFVVFAFPVYSGRVPEVFRTRLKGVKGKNTLAGIVATYGNRDYDDAFLEMDDIISEAGFRTLGAMAVVTEHSIVRKIAAGRPNEEDIRLVQTFGRKINNRLKEITDISEIKKPSLPGNRPYRKYSRIPMIPYSTKKCNGCGACCHVCPVGAISYDGQCHTDKEKCFGCMRCVRVCSQKARTVGKIKEIGASFSLRRLTKEEKKSEIFS